MATYPQVEQIKTDNDRLPQLVGGQGNNAYCRASDYNKFVYFMMNLNLLQDAADDSAAAALTPSVPIGGLYRTTSTIKVRVA